MYWLEIKRGRKPYWVWILWYRQVFVWIQLMGHYVYRTKLGYFCRMETTIQIEYIGGKS